MKSMRVVFALLAVFIMVTTIACSEEEPQPTPTPTPTPTIPPPMADLIVTGVTFDPVTGCTGEPIQVTVTIENQGTLASPACHWSWTLYAGTDRWDNLPALAPGAAVTVQTEMALESDITGTFNTTAMADSMSEVAELNESDNGMTQQLIISVCEYDEDYLTVKGEIQTALDTYTASHNGSIPDTTRSITLLYPAGTFNILDICELIGAGDLLEGVPTGCRDDNFDNCDAGTCNCDSGAHYIWLVDLDGNMLSSCMGNDCDTNYTDGYQSVWP
ncbi:MAG: CARDB domain-containing protein [Chloroflexota bacterium]|nr:CARDB domain-containing protein [Chloroflexota bacterium]